MPALLTSFLLLLGQLYAAATPKFEPILFARVIVDKPILVKGDSTLVSVVLYSDGAFSQAKCSSGELRPKGCTARRIGNSQHRLTGQAVWQGRRYNTLVWAQYIVASSKPTRVKIPPMKFTATLHYRLRSTNPFDELWERKGSLKSFTAKCRTEAAAITFKETPKRDTRTLISSGASTV